MYILSVKLDVKKILYFIVVLCIIVAVVCSVVFNRSDDVLGDNVVASGKNSVEHVEFLKNYGYNVIDKPVQIQEIIIPKKFSSEYDKYNELQKMSGFDLSDYKGYRVKKYSYKILDYADSGDEVVANLYIYNNKIIGGDICSTSFGGFIHGIIKE